MDTAEARTRWPEMTRCSRPGCWAPVPVGTDFCQKCEAWIARGVAAFDAYLAWVIYMRAAAELVRVWPGVRG